MWCGKDRAGPASRHSGFWGTVALHFPKDNLTVAVAVTEQSQYGAIFGVVAAVGKMFFAPQ